MVATVGSIAIDMIVNAAKFVAGFKGAATTVERESGRMTRSINSVEKSLASLRTFQNAFRGLIGAAAVKEVIDYGDAWTTAGNKIRSAAEISGIETRSLSNLNDVASETRSGLTETVQLYSKLILSSKNLGASEAEIAQVTETLSKAFKAGGASAQEAEAAVIQLTQALASGVLQGDELRSLREFAPVVAQGLANEFGTTIGGLKALGAQGALTADRVFQAILKSQKSVDEAFAKTKATVGESFTLVSNSLIEFVGKLEGAFGVLSGFAKEVSGAADTIERLGNALTVFNANKTLENLDKIRQILLGVNVKEGGFADQIVKAFTVAPGSFEDIQEKLRATEERISAVQEVIAQGTLMQGPFPDIDVSPAIHELRSLEAEADNLRDKLGKVPVDLDTSAAKAKIADLAQAFRAAENASMDALQAMQGGVAGGLPHVTGSNLSRPQRRLSTSTITPSGNEIVTTKFSSDDRGLVKGVSDSVDDTTGAVDQATNAIRSADSRQEGYFGDLNSTLDKGLSGIASSLSYRVPAGGGYATGDAANSFKFSGLGNSGSWAGRRLTFGGGGGGESNPFGALGMFSGLTDRNEMAGNISDTAPASSQPIVVNISVKPIIEGGRLSSSSRAEIQQAAAAGANAALRAYNGR